jgi:ABC-type uncharacterized transport system permease subunit
VQLPSTSNSEEERQAITDDAGEKALRSLVSIRQKFGTSARNHCYFARSHKRQQQTEAAMTWTATNLVIQIIAGILGGHGVAVAAKEHSFGALGHTIAGAVGGAVSGYFLQTIVGTVVTGTGDIQQDADLVTQWVLQGLAGLAAGGIVTMAVGFLKHSIDQHRMGKL